MNELKNIARERYKGYNGHSSFKQFDRAQDALKLACLRRQLLDSMQQGTETIKNSTCNHCHIKLISIANPIIPSATG